MLPRCSAWPSAAVIAGVLVVALGTTLLARMRQLRAQDRDYVSQLQKWHEDQQQLLASGDAASQGTALQPPPTAPRPLGQQGNTLVRCLDSLLLMCKFKQHSASALASLPQLTEPAAQRHRSEGRQQAGMGHRQPASSHMSHKLTQVTIVRAH